ncbi:MAG: hypothetical protein F6K48_00205 [Okeania sp. SIO3H1]|nr:hypothetical protein [Okeania sp. SIO3H1]
MWRPTPTAPRRGMWGDGESGGKFPPFLGVADSGYDASPPSKPKLGGIKL